MAALALIGGLGHIIGGILFAGIALWVLSRGAGGMHRLMLSGAALLTLLWSASVVAQGDGTILPGVMENLRNLGWLALMLMLVMRGRRDSGRRSILLLYGVIGAVSLAQIALQMIAPQFAASPRAAGAFALVANMLGMTIAVGALVLVHNLYTAAAPEARWGIRLPMVALAAMWTFDLNLYTIAYLTERPAAILYMLRGLTMIPIAGLFVLGSRRNLQWRVQLSRSMTFQTLSLMAIGGYLVLMMLVVRALNVVGVANVQVIQLTAIVVMSAVGGALLPSPRLRAWVRAALIKHFFRHRYDYRTEWLRFTETLGRPGKDAAPLDVRVVKAIADITESPGGALLVPDGNGALVPGARWSWPALDIPPLASDAQFTQRITRDPSIIELDMARQGQGDGDTPRWMLDTPRLWAAVPLVHFGRLMGLVVLERPLIDRMLDWEDFDLLRLAGRQVASYLAEARGQEELSDARRFDEFNRRFAFLMHDIKNLVSQLTLVARNAERHADNPAFRADMVATLRSSADKMNDLLARLSQHNRPRGEEPRTVSLRAIVDSVAASRRGAHPLRVDGRSDILATADPTRLEQALLHLVQNAIDASASGQPVMLEATRRDGEAVVSVIDRGKGMSEEFVRNSLFRPFASTKPDGFGIGAFEARTLVAGMGGRIEVSSREGGGSRFDIILPAASDADRAEPRKRLVP